MPEEGKQKMKEYVKEYLKEYNDQGKIVEVDAVSKFIRDEIENSINEADFHWDQIKHT